jgi:LysR family transcriptional regulator, nitrogen assimilation regulatory protein
MQINDLRLFLEVAEQGSFTKVAIQRNTVQSHISRQISELEQNCGNLLFKRTGRGVVLTEFGIHVQQQVKGWLKGTDELFANLKQTSRIPMGEVKIGLLPSAAHPLMTEIYKRLNYEYPKIKLNIREGQGSELDAMLDTGSVDMAILFRYQKPSGTDETLLSTANTYLVSGSCNAITSSKSIEFKHLEGLQLVLPRQPSHWRSIIDETAKSKGFSLIAEVEADSLRLQKEILATNPNIFALLGPFSINEELRTGKLKATKIVSPDLKRYVTLAHPKQGSLTQACKVVSQLIKETVAEWKGQLSNQMSNELSAKDG